MFRKPLTSLVLLAVFAAVLSTSFKPALADAVDLRDKKGVVDPADLKKYDPPERGLRIKEPPPPGR